MAADVKPGWSKPSTILFTSEYPANEKAFTFALAQASEFGAELVIFHVSDKAPASVDDAAALSGSEYAAVRAAKQRFDALCRRARDLGVRCKVVIRMGWPAEQILAYMRDNKVDRVIMGAHSPGPVGKLLVGSVAESVLRNSTVPVCIVSPHVAEDSYRNPSDRKILCDVSHHHARPAVATFGAALANSHNASLILQSVILPQDRDEVLAARTIDELEAELPALISSWPETRQALRTRLTFGDPIEELLYQGRSKQVHMIVLGAHGASQFAAVSRAGSLYKILAYSHCPVMVLSPVLLTEFGPAQPQTESKRVHYVAGVI